MPPGHGLTFFVQGETHRYLGIVNDISDDGMGVTVGKSFEPGTVLEFVLEEDEQESYFIGEVMWCKPDQWLEDTYHMGVATRAKVVT